MALAFFDLDETLISADSDHAWGDFIADRGLVDPEEHKARNAAFYEDYKRGELDIDAYMRFSCLLLSRLTMPELEAIRDQFFEERVRPMLLPRAEALLAEHRAKGNEVIVVTATIEFITRPIATFYGVEHLIAPVPEVRDGRYTGEIVGVPSFREGKVIRINEFLERTGQTLAGSYCYSDSRNDIPMLELVDNPVAVDPDPELRRVAQERKWPIISLRS
ncbi:MAG: HAD family hydrolase [Pseudomonadales bacterium]|nr:HAD family hydrolase [Pseudomonadales bacterium]